MATHSRILAWRIPWTEEPGGLQSMGSQRVRHNLMTNTHTRLGVTWKRKCQPTLIFLPGKSVYSQSPQGGKELNMTQ